MKKTRIPVPAHPFPTSGGTFTADAGKLTQAEAPALPVGPAGMADRQRDTKRAATPKASEPASEEVPAPAEEPATDDKPRKPRKS